MSIRQAPITIFAGRSAAAGPPGRRAPAGRPGWSAGGRRRVWFFSASSSSCSSAPSPPGCCCCGTMYASSLDRCQTWRKSTRSGDFCENSLLIPEPLAPQSALSTVTDLRLTRKCKAPPLAPPHTLYLAKHYISSSCSCLFISLFCVCVFFLLLVVLATPVQSCLTRQH